MNYCNIMYSPWGGWITVLTINRQAIFKKGKKGELGSDHNVMMGKKFVIFRSIILNDSLKVTFEQRMEGSERKIIPGRGD